LHIALQQRANAAAMRMSQHDKMLDIQLAHAEFQRGAGAVIMALVFCGRNKVGDVADDEQVARRAIQNQSRIDARIAAGDH